MSRVFVAGVVGVVFVALGSEASADDLQSCLLRNLSPADENSVYEGLRVLVSPAAPEDSPAYDSMGEAVNRTAAKCSSQVREAQKGYPGPVSFDTLLPALAERNPARAGFRKMEGDGFQFWMPGEPAMSGALQSEDASDLAKVESGLTWTSKVGGATYTFGYMDFEPGGLDESGDFLNSFMQGELGEGDAPDDTQWESDPRPGVGWTDVDDDAMTQVRTVIDGSRLYILKVEQPLGDSRRQFPSAFLKSLSFR